MYLGAVPMAVFLRRIVLLWFGVLGLYQGGQSAIWMVQSLQNLTWEIGFYGAPSVHTSAALAWSLLMGVVAIGGWSGAIAFAAGSAWGTPMLILVTILSIDTTTDAVGTATLMVLAMIVAEPLALRLAAALQQDDSDRQ